MAKMLPVFFSRALGVAACLCAGIALVAAANSTTISTEGGGVNIKSGAGISMEVVSLYPGRSANAPRVG